jgi:ferritin-like metal-binding protein YciE
MKRINSLNDLLMEELADLLNAENQLSEALPKMVEASQSLTLKLVLQAQLEVTKEHAYRLQDILSNLGQKTQGVTCKVMKGLIQESEDVIHKTENGQARDIAIISMMQRVEKYEISGYGTAMEHAVDLGQRRVVEVLDKTINEERAMNLHLSELAQGIINLQATDPNSKSQKTNQQQESPLKAKSGGFYVPEGKFGRGGIKKKSKITEVSRFISEGNPNIQDDSDKLKDKPKSGEEDVSI